MTRRLDYFTGPTAGFFVAAVLLVVIAVVDLVQWVFFAITEDTD